MEVKVGVVHTGKELTVELGDDADSDSVLGDIRNALAEDDVIWLTDKKGRKVGVPSSKVAYVEIAEAGEKTVGFGR